MLRWSLAIRRRFGTAAVWAIGLLSAAPFDGWPRQEPTPSGAESARLHLRSLLLRSAGRFIERSGSDRFRLWMFGLPVYVSRSDAVSDVQLPSGLIVRGVTTEHGSVELFRPSLPEFNDTRLVLVPTRRRSKG